ncbi:MAG: M23 family metallopeptidase [Clostridia bacterium]|nr:M23 family metallopeptidase [Clostridia bacterium]
MKYSQNPKFRGSLTFYTVVACCLVAIGGASYFALSKDKTSVKNNVSDNQSYKAPLSSYNSNGTPKKTESKVESKTEANKTVSDVPYEESKVESSTNTPPVQEKAAFVLPAEGKIIKNYSDTALQYSSTYNDMRLHLGIDIACKKNSNIKAVTNGTVTAVEKSVELGNVITVDHGSGIKVKYCGLKDVKLKAGQSVKAGDILGLCDTVPSECADEEHIHIEAFKDDKSVSPLEIIGLNQ